MLELNLEHIGFIVDRLLALPQQISDVELEEWQFKIAITNAKDDLNQYKYGFETQISLATDDAGKLKFSNQAKRDLELKRLLDTNEECVTIAKVIQYKEGLAKTKTVEMWKLKNEFGSLKHELVAITSVLNALSDPIARKVLNVTDEF